MSASLAYYFLEILKAVDIVIFTSVLSDVTRQLCDIRFVKTSTLSVEKTQNLYHHFKGKQYFKINICKIESNYVVMLQNAFQLFLSHSWRSTPQI